MPSALRWKSEASAVEPQNVHGSVVISSRSVLARATEAANSRSLTCAQAISFARDGVANARCVEMALDQGKRSRTCNTM